MVDMSGLQRGFISMVAINAIRSFLNTSMEEIRPGQVVMAIRQDLSLWKVAGRDISQIANKIPPSFIAAGKPTYRVAISEHGTATNLVLKWLKEDNLVMYSLITNTEGGMEWFDRQVREICKQFNLDYSV